MKCCRNSEFFSIEVIKTTSNISSAEIHVDLGCFVLNKFCFKRKKYFKFYQSLILLSGDISLNPGPSQYLQDNDNKFESFHKLGLHFLHINGNSLLLKIYELTDQEVNINGYSVLRSDRDRKGRDVACYVRGDPCFNSRNIFSNSIDHVFFIYLS